MARDEAERSALIEQALSLAAAGDRPRALAALAAAVALQGGHRAAFEALIARSRGNAGALALAERLMIDLAGQGPDRPMQRDLAALFRANRRWTHLLELGEPLPPEAHQALGRAADDAGEFEAALGHFRQAAAAWPPAAADLGAALWRLGDDAGAEPWLTRAQALAPGDWAVAGVRASALVALGRGGEAEAAFAGALRALTAWGAPEREAAREALAEPQVARAMFAAASRLAPAAWQVAFERRAQGGGPETPPDATEPWASLLVLPDRQRLTIGVVGLVEPEGLAALASAGDELLVLMPRRDAEAARLAAQAGARAVPTPPQPGLIRQINAVREAANGDWLLFMAPGDTLGPGMARLFRRAIQRPVREDGAWVTLGGWVVTRRPEPPHATLHAFKRMLVGPVAGPLGSGADGRLVAVDAAGRPVPMRQLDMPHLRIEHRGQSAAHKLARYQATLDQLAAAPRHATRLWLAGFQAGKAGRVDEAIDLLGRCLEVLAARGREHENTARLAAITLANHLLNQHRHAESLAVCERALQAWRDDADLLATAAIAHLFEGRPAAAIAPLERALAQAARPATSVSFKPYTGWLAELLLAIAHWKLGEAEACDRRLAAAWATSPDRREAWRRLEGYTRALGGRPDDARALLARIGETPPA